jgi:hypothetical protein
MSAVTIPERFNGPPGSAHGGYACGVEADATGLGASVRLTAPPPLGVPLSRRRDPDGLVRLLHDGATGGQAVDARFVWAALDCPSGFAFVPPGTVAVLGTMTARLEAPVLTGRDYVLAGWPLGAAGRMHRAGAALYERGGRRVALAESLWITPRARA